MRKPYLTLVLVLATAVSFAQIPNGYYDPAQGLTGNQLKNALHNIIDGHVEFPYSSSSTDTWDILKEADRDPNNPNNVLGIYSNFSMNAAAEYDGGNGWNREHVWAKSRGDFGTTMGAGTDLHHLRAADVSTNSARSNRNFDECTEQYVDNGGSHNGPTPSFTSSTDFTWEPPAGVKGDVARMLFYMVVRYEGTNGDPDLELQEAYLSNTSKEPFHARLSTLLQWHLDDPVDNAERNRNDIIHSYQQNRNPFIDHPEYVCEIWSCSGTGNSAPSFTSTPITSATEGQGYVYSVTSTDSNGDAITLTAPTRPSWLSFSDNGNGTASLSGTPSVGDIGNHSVVLQASDGINTPTSQSFTVTVSGTSGGSGPASDLFFSEYIEGSSYNKGLEIANFTGSAVNLSSYSLKKQVNGAGSWGSTLNLSGSISDGGVYVVVNNQAPSEMQNQADLSTSSAATTFNGNDPVGLFKNDVLIDVIGNFNGGSSNFAKDVTLVRNSSIGDPNTSYVPGEWTSYPQNTFTYLGSHTFSGGGAGTICDIPSNLQSSNVTTSAATINWTATSANDYGVRYRQQGTSNWTNINESSTSVTLSSLVASTTYEVQVRSQCGATNSSYSGSEVLTTANPPANQLLSQSYFESGWDGWTDGGGDCSRYSGSRSWEGNYSIRLRDNSGTSSAMTSQTYDVSAFSNLEIEFYFYAYSMESGEDFWVRYYDGSSWSTVETYARGTDFDNNSFYVATVNISSAQYNFPSNAQVRFQCDASANGDHIYIDEVTITGMNGSSGRSSSGSLIKVKSLEESSTLPSDLKNELFLYPNPVTNNLYVHYPLATDQVQVSLYDINGKVMTSMALETSHRMNVDTSYLEKGIYILQIADGEKRIRRKFIKE